MTNIEDVAKLKETVESFAQEIGLTKEKYDEIVAKAEKEMEVRKVPDDQKEYYVYRRVQFALKQRARSAGQEAEGFFFAQQRTVDYARNPRQRVQDFISEEGLKLAIALGICDKNKNPLSFYIHPDTKEPVLPVDDEEKDELEEVAPLSENDLVDYIIQLGEAKAKKVGMMNEDGEMLYLSPEFKKGKVIPDHEYGCTAYGVFKMPGDTDPKVSEIVLYGDVANSALPLFQIVKFPSRINKDKSTANTYRLSMSKPISDYGEEVDYNSFDGLIRKTVPDRRLDSIEEIDAFLDDHTDFNEWCIVDADISEVSSTVSQYDSIAVKLGNVSSSMKNMTDEMTVWVNVDRAKGLVEAGDSVVFLKPRKRDDGSIAADLIGYYIDPTFRPLDVDELSSDDLLDPW